MTTTYQMPAEMAEARTLITARLASILPPALALLFPLSVWCFYTSTVMVRQAGGWSMVLPLVAAAISLALAAAPTIASYLMLLRPLEQADRFAGTRWITYLAFVTP